MVIFLWLIVATDFDYNYFKNTKSRRVISAEKNLFFSFYVFLASSQENRSSKNSKKIHRRVISAWVYDFF